MPFSIRPVSPLRCSLSHNVRLRHVSAAAAAATVSGQQPSREAMQDAPHRCRRIDDGPSLSSASVTLGGVHKRRCKKTFSKKGARDKKCARKHRVLLQIHLEIIIVTNGWLLDRIIAVLVARNPQLSSISFLFFFFSGKIVARLFIIKRGRCRAGFQGSRAEMRAINQR